MIPWMRGSESDPDTPETEARQAMREQEEKLRETLLTVPEVHSLADRSRKLLTTDLLATAIERSMRRV